MSENNKVSLKINNNKCIQENFRGVGAVYHAYTFREDFPGKQYTEEECSIELERVKNMELKIARTYFDLVAYKDGKWDWECKEMQAFYKWLSKMQEFDVEVALNAAWWVSGHIISNKESPLYNKNPKLAAKNYGHWVSEVVHQLIEIRGFSNIKYLILLTEPNDACWTLSHEREDLPGYKAYELCAKAVDYQLRADNRRELVKLVGPNAGIPDFGNPTMLEWATQNLNDNIDIYSSHTYMDYLHRIDVGHETYSGVGSLCLNTPGFRAQQFVNLEPNTNYELSLYAKAAKGSDIKKWERGFLFGAFETTENENRLIRAGKEGISYLTKNSVTSVPVKALSDSWQKYTMRFNTENKCYAHIGIYHDVLPFNSVIFYDNVSLHKVGNTEELLENGDFEDRDSTAWLAFRGGIRYTDDNLPLYSSIKLMLKRYLRCIPQGSEFWFDEYNTRFYDIYGDAKQGISLAEVQAAFLNSGVNCNLLWSLFDQRWPYCKWDGFDCFIDGDHRFGLMPNLKRTKTPYPAYYAFTLMAKYMGDHNSKIFEGDAADTICASCVLSSDGNYSILVVNSGNGDREISINFEEDLNRNLYRHLYNSNEIVPNDRAQIIGIDKNFESVKLKFEDTIPANSMAIYTTRTD